MKKIDLSAIIVAFNSQKTISKCIDSLQISAKTAKLTLEIIVVINDNLNYQFLPKSVIKVKSGKNTGYAQGINLGAKKAQGEYLIIANPDTVTSPHALKELITVFKNKKTGVAGPKIINPDGKTQLSVNFEPNLWNIFLEQSYLYKILPLLPQSKTNPQLYDKIHQVEAVEGTYFVIKKNIFQQLKGMDEKFFLYFEDLDLQRRVRDRGYKIIYQPKSRIFHYGQVSSGGYTQGNFYLKSCYLYLRKYHSLNYAFLGTALFYLGCLGRLFFWQIFNKGNKNKIIFLRGAVRQFSLIYGK